MRKLPAAATDDDLFNAAKILRKAKTDVNDVTIEEALDLEWFLGITLAEAAR